MFLSLLIGDFVHNVRSALDHAIYEISSLSDTDKLRKHLQFPICDTSEKYAEACRRHQLDGLLHAQEVIIERYQPYNFPQGFSDDALSLLREINIVDKHHIIQVTAASGEHATVKVSGIINVVARGGGKINLGNSISIQQVNNGVMGERESVVGKIYYSSKQNRSIELKPTIKVEFGEGKPRVEGRQVVTTLTAILNRIEEIVRDLKAAI